MIGSEYTMIKLFRTKIILLIFSVLVFNTSYLVASENTALAQTSNKSIRFTGSSGSRIAISLSGPLNVGSGDFTIEWWMKPMSINAGAPCSSGPDVFTNGALIIDRDVFGPGDYGDYGLSLMSDGEIAFSIHNGSTGITACSRALPLNQWSYIAAVRQGNEIRIYVNGELNDRKTLSGNLSYRSGRETSYIADPYLVIGAEKHTAIGGQSFTAYHYNGLMDELRISNIARTISPVNSPFNVDANTVALFNFEGNTNSLVGGYSSTSAGVSFTEDVPFTGSTIQPTITPTSTPTTNPTSSPTTTPTVNLTASPTSGPTSQPGSNPTPTNPTNTPTSANLNQPIYSTDTEDEEEVSIIRVTQDYSSLDGVESESSSTQSSSDSTKKNDSQANQNNFITLLFSLFGFVVLLLVLYVLYENKDKLKLIFYKKKKGS